MAQTKLLLAVHGLALAETLRMRSVNESVNLSTCYGAKAMTPFEKGVVHFLVDTDIASHIHLLKHRISSLNAESARYKELKEDKYFIPDDWNDKWKNTLKDYSDAGNDLYHQCLSELEPILGRKRAKESARFFKTYNSQIQADIMFNMRSFANFIKLRDSEHAQTEIREIAQEMWNLVENIEGQPFKYTLEAIRVRIQSNS